MAITRVKTWVSAESLDASDLNAEFDNIINNLDTDNIDDYSGSVAEMKTTANPGDVGSESQATSLTGEITRLRYVLNQMHGGAQWYSVVSQSLGGVPIGSIIPWYDFDATVSLPGNYLYCNGAAISDSDSVLDSETLPDLSNRYLVGFGTEGGEDIGSASWATAAVGDADHEIDLSHSHTVDGHVHTGPSHTHTGPSHTHLVAYLSTATGGKHFSVGIEDAQISAGAGTVDNRIDSASGGNIAVDLADSFSAGKSWQTEAQGTGNTGSGGTGNTGSTSPGTDSQLSSTQSFQPRSIRVRYIMRIK